MSRRSTGLHNCNRHDRGRALRADGDVHMRVAVSASLVNQANDEYEHGDLVAEIICVGIVTQADAVAACQGYRDAVTIPAVGDSVSIIGS